MTPRQLLLCIAVATTLGAAASAGAATKDIVLDRVNPSASAATTDTRDAMVASVLVESPDGTLSPRATNATFRTGDRFRVKLLTSREGHIALYNTKPSGERVAQAVWRGPVQRGLETITPRLRLEGQRGTDQLHVVFEPKLEERGGVLAWLDGLLRGSSKDIRLDVQNTSTDTYLLGGPNQGLLTTLRITHR